MLDYCVVGGGIVGLATAATLLARSPGASLLLLEKEAVLAAHQTGHNSGVIHSGVYYEPGSLKATLCKRGSRATKDFCDQHGIPYETCGKILVATSGLDVRRMQALSVRGEQNGIRVQELSAAELAECEPAISGLGALLILETAIVDFRAVSEAMADEVRLRGGYVELSAEVTAIRESSSGVTVSTSRGDWTARRLVVCGGLQADRLARLAGIDPTFRVVPFRGEYYRLSESRSDIIRHLIYPIPDPDLPFLGVHLTRTVDGGVTVGPNAVLATSREVYRKFSFDVHDVGDFLGYPGFWRFAKANLRLGAIELRNSLFKRGYLEACRRYCPSLSLHDLLPSPPGIRAQAMLSDGTLVHDFLFEESPRTLHVCNAPSPAATSAIPIAEMIADQLHRL